jgi:steroid 5-alpha reductase family enzyme
MINLVLICWAVLALALALLWARQIKTKNATSVDVAWSAGLGFLAVVYPWFSDGSQTVRVLVGTLGGIWALRLAWYLWTDRVLAATDEDGRYRAMREHFGPKINLFLFFFYQGQAAVAVLFSLPMLAAMARGSLDVWTLLGVAVWLVAVTGETVADRQLARFRADPANRGQVCQDGLWRFSRHPNYFFEWVHWWSYVLIGHAALLTWIGPVGMLLFLFRLTGIPYTENQAIKSRGDLYREYQRTTSVFIPWFPKRAP